jgi:hypothetical protein
VCHAIRDERTSIIERRRGEQGRGQESVRRQ